MLRAIGSACLAAGMLLTAPIGPVPEKTAYTIIANSQTLDLSDLPYSAYLEGERVMVPMRKIGEALGYEVDWRRETGEIVMEDSVQRVILRDGERTARIESKLRIIDLSRDVEMETPATVYDGHTYVPVELFEEFFDEVTVDGTTVTVEPQVYELQG